MEHEDTRVISESPKFLAIEELQKLAFNAGIDAALESLPEPIDDYFTHEHKEGFNRCLDQAREAIEKARRG